MGLRGFRTVVACQFVAACCALTLVSCERSVAPVGRLLVYVSEDGVRPAPGKTIEIGGTSLRQSTDEDGFVLFNVPEGSHVVRAYDLGTPGPGRPFVEQEVEVKAARTTRAQFNDCTMCR